MSPRPDAPPRRLRAIAPLLALCLALAGSPGRVVAQGLAMGTGACTKVEFTAEDGDCKGDHCHLAGDVRLVCETMKLFSETLDLDFKNGQFAGGIARGDVMVADGNRLITCDSFAIGPDRIQTTLQDAVVQVKRTNAVDPTSGLPTGRNQAVYQGSRMDRPTAKRLIIDDGSFTLCDCGKDKKPSWHLTSPHIDAELDERATIMWPVFWITPFGIPVDVPLTPPLLPMSVPLKSRALGFLAPKIGFVGPYPSIDLPFFVPLGDSWDVTLTSGLRSDWSPSHEASPSTWGAPHLGSRLRYAPVTNTSGDWSFDWYHDALHGAAFVAADGGTPGNYPQYYLRERVGISGNHRTDFGKDATLLLKVQWVSDDAYLGDTAQMVWPYLPTRGQLQWRGGGFETRVGADYLERIRPPPPQADVYAKALPRGFQNLSNTELATAQHGPYLRATLTPLSLPGGFSVSGDASLDRYGGWSSSSEAAPNLVLLRAAPGVAFSQTLGPVALTAHGSFDAAWLTTGTGLESPTRSLAITTDAQASMMLARRFGSVVHAVLPRLEYRGLPWRAGPALQRRSYQRFTDSAGKELSLPVSFLDERLRRDRTVEQAAVGLWQELSTGAGTSLTRVATLDLSQPIDLETFQALPARISAFAGHPAWGTITAEATVYLPGIGRPGQEDVDTNTNRALRELMVGVGSPPAWPVAVAVDYRRYTPETSRFLRTIYELEAPLDAPETVKLPWRSYITPSVTLTLKPSLTVRYSAPYDLAVPGSTETGIATHMLQVLYHSPCDCWDLTLTATKYRDYPGLKNLKLGFTISIAGFAIGGNK